MGNSCSWGRGVNSLPRHSRSRQQIWNTCRLYWRKPIHRLQLYRLALLTPPSYRPETFCSLVAFLLFLLNEDIKNLSVLVPCWVCVQLLGAAFHLAHSCCGTSTPRDTEGDGNSCFSFAIPCQSDSNTFPLYSAAPLAKKLCVWKNRKIE